jgi:hypothetical protein
MQSSTNVEELPPLSVTVDEMIELLIKHHHIHDGLFGLAVQFQFAVGGVGISPNETYPGVMLGVSGFGLAPALSEGSRIINAAIVNPKPAKKISAKQAPTKK